MNGAKTVRKYAVSEAVARGACPICTVLRHRQTLLFEENGIPDAAHLCNHHAWLLAKLAPASSASEILLNTLRARHREGPRADLRLCDFCEALKQEEEEQLKDLAEKMKTAAFVEWMRINGTMCLRHVQKISQRVPATLRPAIAQLLSRNLKELEQDLEEFAKHAIQGEHAGGGVLGRAAEFLVCQRGIPREETPC